jgi:hypothetical protein
MSGLEAVLAAHVWLGSDEQKVDDRWTWGFDCECGEFVPDGVGNRHIAAAIVAHLTSEAEQAADEHMWEGGYYCSCGHDLNSPAGFSRHLVHAALTAATEATP